MLERDVEDDGWGGALKHTNFYAKHREDGWVKVTPYDFESQALLASIHRRYFKVSWLLFCFRWLNVSLCKPILKFLCQTPNVSGRFQQ